MGIKQQVANSGLMSYGKKTISLLLSQKRQMASRCNATFIVKLCCYLNFFITFINSNKVY